MADKNRFPNEKWGSFPAYRGSQYDSVQPPTSQSVLTHPGTSSLPLWKTIAQLLALLTHNLLSATHSDTVAGTPVRGDIIVANSTPKWTKLATGTATQLMHGGTDPSYTAVTSADLGLTTNGDLLVQAAGIPSRVAVGSATQVVHGGTAPTYGAIVAADLATPFGAWTAFTPTISSSGGGTPGSYTGAGAYIQLGKTLFVQYTIVITTAAPATGFISATLPNSLSAVRTQYITGRDDAGGLPGMIAGRANGTTFLFVKYNDGNTAVNGVTLIASGVIEVS